jgi:hypothetical protein
MLRLEVEDSFETCREDFEHGVFQGSSALELEDAADHALSLAADLDVLRQLVAGDMFVGAGWFGAILTRVLSPLLAASSRALIRRITGARPNPWASATHQAA